MYYGDEIGMGDNIYLGDRNGVRTPMQWNSEKNHGFSDADADMLYLPVDNSEYAPTVENQKGREGSIYENIRSLIYIRKENPELSNDSAFEIVYARHNEYPFVYRRGSFTAFVNPGNDSKTVDYAANGAAVKYAIGGFDIGENTVTIHPRSFLLLKHG